MTAMISFAIFGLVAGAIARLLHPGRDPMGWIWTMLLGMGGALLGGWLGGLMGFDVEGGLTRWVFAVLGAIALLMLYHATTRRTAITGGPATSGPATSNEYKAAVFDDLSRGPRG